MAKARDRIRPADVPNLRSMVRGQDNSVAHRPSTARLSERPRFPVKPAGPRFVITGPSRAEGEARGRDWAAGRATPHQLATIECFASPEVSAVRYSMASLHAGFFRIHSILAMTLREPGFLAEIGDISEVRISFEEGFVDGAMWEWRRRKAELATTAPGLDGITLVRNPFAGTSVVAVTDEYLRDSHERIRLPHHVDMPLQA